MAGILGVLSFFLAAFVSLITIVNPFGTTSLFLKITKGDSQERKRAMAKRAAIVSALTLIGFALIGGYALRLFSITLDAFRIAGGILIAGIGYHMIKAKREHISTEEEKREAISKDDVSIIPLAIPMTAGPGAMTTSLVLMGQATGFADAIAIVVAIILSCVIAFIVFVQSERISSLLGETGQKVTDRVLGLIVMVVGVQFIINGVANVVANLGLSPLG